MRRIVPLLLSLLIAISAHAQGPAAPAAPPAPAQDIAEAQAPPHDHENESKPTTTPPDKTASPKAGPNHTVAVTFQNASCNTVVGPCTGQIYRANSVCPSGGGIAGPTWVLVTGILTATTVTATNSTFNYTDAGVINGNTYCYYATNQYQNQPGLAEGPSGPSNTFQVQIAGPPQNPTGFSGTVN